MMMNSTTAGPADCSNVDISLEAAIVCFVFAVITTGGNLLIIAAVWKDPLGELRTNSNYLIVNLAVADLLLGLVCEPLFGLQYWYKNLEATSYTIMYLGAEASCLSVVALTVERFIVIEFPLRSSELQAPCRLKLCIAVIWIVSLVLALLPEMGWKSQAQYRLFLFDVIGLFICVIMLGLYIRMFVVIRRFNRSFLNGEENQVSVQLSRDLVAAQEREQEVTKAIFLFFGLYVLCWTPSVVMENIIYFNCIDPTVTVSNLSVIQHIIQFTGLMNSVLNPLLYGLRMPKFRRAVRQMCCCSVRQRSRPFLL